MPPPPCFRSLCDPRILKQRQREIQLISFGTVFIVVTVAIMGDGIPLKIGTSRQRALLDDERGDGYGDVGAENRLQRLLIG